MNVGEGTQYCPCRQFQKPLHSPLHSASQSNTATPAMLFSVPCGGKTTRKPNYLFLEQFHPKTPYVYKMEITLSNLRKNTSSTICLLVHLLESFREYPPSVSPDEFGHPSNSLSSGITDDLFTPLPDLMTKVGREKISIRVLDCVSKILLWPHHLSNEMALGVNCLLYVHMCTTG